MEVVLRVAALALVGALLTLALQRHAPEHAMLTALACGAVLLWMGMDSLSSLVQLWQRLAARIPYADVLAAPLFKAAGVSIAARLAAFFCRDCGQSALGAKVELVGTSACLVLLFPLTEQVLDVLESLW